MSDYVRHKAASTVTLAAATAGDLLASGSAGFEPEDCDEFVFSVNNAGAATIETIQVWGAPFPGSTQFSAQSPSMSLATLVAGTITVTGWRGGPLRLIGTSATGSVGVVSEVGCYKSGNNDQVLSFSINGIAQGNALGGTISGNLSQSGGTATIEATGAASLDATTSVTIAGTNATSLVLGATGIVPSLPGGVTIAAAKAIDVTSAGALNIGTTTATSVVIGKTGGTVAPSFPGGLTVAAAKAIDATTAGALNIGPTTATSVVVGSATVAAGTPGGVSVGSAKAVTGVGAMAVEATGALSLGVNASSTSIVVGQATVAPSFTGGVSIASAKAVTGAGAMAVEATGALSLGAAASTTSTDIGRAGNVTSSLGTLLLSNALRAVVADAGAAAASGTANGCFTTFTIASGQTGYVLTNDKAATTSLVFIQCISGAVGQAVLSAIPTASTVTVLLGGAAGANAKFACLIVNV